METTEITKILKHKSVFQTFPDFLKDTWKNDEARPDIYLREQQFAYFWDCKEAAVK